MAQFGWRDGESRAFKTHVKFHYGGVTAVLPSVRARDQRLCAMSMPGMQTFIGPNAPNYAV